jgi:NADH:ubiquinone reductase (H+-translocating)
MSKIVIVGAGYAGMMTATHLDHFSEPFTLVNNHEYHYLTTLLHEAAGGRGEPMNYQIPIQDLLHKDSSELVIDEITGVDRAKRVVIGKNGEWSYDWLIYTLGWVPEYFGIQGLKENSFVLRNLDSAISIRQHISREFDAFREDGNLKHLRVVVGGAGLTGVELLGELLDYIPKLCAEKQISWPNVDVQCIEAMPTVLPQVPESLRGVVKDTLTEKGATLRLNTKIMQVEPGIVHLGDSESVEAGTVIWTGGVRANPVLSDAGFTCDRRGRAKVNAFLQSVDDEHIFIGGDSAWCEENGKPLPPTGQVATQMGKTIAHNVHAMIHGSEMNSFHASLKGTLASLGPEIGVGDIGGIKVKGLVAGLAKEATKVKYLWELGGVRLAAEKSGQMVHL